MMAWLRACCWCVLLVVCFVSTAQAVEVIDDSGRAVRLAQPAARVITLAPNLTELLFDLGTGNRVVATVEFSNFPTAAKKIPRIGSSASLNLESVLAYHPDLVLGWQTGNNPQQLIEIERLGIPVYRSEPGKLQDIPATLIRLGRLLGVQARAQQLAEQMESEITRLKKRYAHASQIRGFYQIWHQPIYTINGRHIISDIMQLCGVHNVFADASIIAPIVSMEAIIARDPQIIISGGSEPMQAKNLSFWRHWPQISAVRANNLYTIDADLMQRDTPRILQGANVLCEQAELSRQHLASLH